MTKKTYISTMVLFAILITLMVVVIGMMVLPCKVLEFKDAKYQILTPEVKPGGIVVYQTKVTKYKDFIGTVSRQLINSFIYTFTPIIGSLPVGYNDKTVQLELPLYIEPGQYYIHIVYSYKINSLRTETYTQDTEKFEVIANHVDETMD